MFLTDAAYVDDITLFEYHVRKPLHEMTIHPWIPLNTKIIEFASLLLEVVNNTGEGSGSWSVLQYSVTWFE